MITRRRLMATSGSAALAATTGLGLGGLGLPGAARAADPLSVTFGPPLPVYALNMVAEEKGFFKEAGIDLKMVTTDAGARARQSLAAGDALFAHGDASHPLQLTNRGKRCKIILSTEMTASYANVCVRKDLYADGIISLEELANWKRPDGGKPIVGATAIGSGTWMFGTYLFEKRGLGKNITWVASGGTSTTLAGLKSKQFDAVMVPPAWQIEAERGGFGQLIYDVRDAAMWKQDFGGNLPVLVIYALEETIDQNPRLVQSYVTALVRTMAWLKKSMQVPALADEAFALVANKYFGGVDPVAVRSELFFDVKTWPTYDGLLRAEDFARGTALWFRPGTDIKPLKYEEVVDMRFAEIAQKSVT